MSINILEKIQENLQYPPLKKIDPNTGHTAEGVNEPAENKLSQAAIPAALTGMYKYVQNDEGANKILTVRSSDNWANEVFENDKKMVLEHISGYAGKNVEEVEAVINTVANEAVKLTKENLPENAGIKDVKTFFSNQRTNILLYLLPELNIGQSLHDDTLDDNTNKMEGPVSSLMQSIGSVFSSPVTDEEIKDK
jgi:hypothetical protein